MSERDRGTAARLRSIFEAAPVGIGLVSDRVLLEVNDRLCAMTGYRADELVGQSARILYPDEEEYLRVGRDKYRQIAAGGSGSVETRWRCKDGTLLDVLLSSAPLAPDDLAAGVTFTALDITELRRAHEALRESERKLRSLFEASTSVSFIVTDLQGEDARILEFSPGAERIFGHARDEVLGRPVAMLHLPEQVAQFPAVQASMRKSREGFTGMSRLVRKGGEVFPAWFSTYPLCDDAGEMVAALGVSIDLTEQKRAEAALRDAELERRTILDSMHHTILLQDLDMRIVWANRTACESSGLPREDLIGRRCFHIWGRREEVCENCPVARALREGRDQQEIMRTPDGKTWHVRGYLVRNAAGEVASVLEVAEDITERVRAAEENTRLATALVQSPEAVVITDPDGIIEYVNPAFERITGYAKDEAIGRSPRLLKSGHHDQRFYEQLWGTLTAGRTWNGHFVNRRKDGSLYHEEASIAPVRAADGTIRNYVAVKRDVTEELRREQQLWESQKMEVVGTLAGGIAHDFNNILSAVLGYVELARADADDPVAVRRSLDEVGRAARRARDLVGQILTFTRQGSQERRPLRLQTVVREVVKLLQGAIPSTIEIRIDLEEDCPAVLGDAGRLHQVVMNLGTNAFQAMHGRAAAPAEGLPPARLELELRRIELTAEEVRHHLGLRPGPHARLRVRDNGVGMDEATCERIFEPYFTTREKGKGTGLGLAVVRGIVQAHEGVVEVRSRPGEGSTFDVFLPAAGVEVASEEVPVASTAPRGGEHVLLVDDEEPILDVVGRSLERLGYRVTACRNGHEALERLDREPEAFDVVITDQTMPRMTGLELARQLRRRRADLPVILCSGFGSDLGEAEARAAGVHASVMKPVLPADLARLVRQAVDG